MQLFVDRVSSPVGTIVLVWDAEGALRALDFSDHEPRMRRLLRRHYGNDELEEGRAPVAITGPLAAFFAGDLAALDAVAVRTNGTEFQRRVWSRLRRIPAGTTMTYGQLAAAIGAPSASRAVGLANGANPVGIVVPCHRVIGADGTLTGYGGGLPRKQLAAVARERPEGVGMSSQREQSERFRALHAPGKILVLPNAWDAGSARLIESCGAKAIATTSSGVAWSLGYPDGNVLPLRELAAAVARIARVITVPLSVDAEAGYSDDPKAAAEVVAAVVAAGAVGVNLEDGGSPPELLCAKIGAAKEAASRAGVDLFVNARTDVFLHGLVGREERVAETIRRARLYQGAGCDSVFVPAAANPDVIRELARGIELPLNVMLVPKLPPVSELAALGVRRVSAGGAITQAVYGLARRATTELLEKGIDGGLFDAPATYAELNALFAKAGNVG